MITDVERRRFFDDGYLIVEGAVSKTLIDTAMRAINHSLGEGLDPQQMVEFRARTFTPELQRSAVLTALTQESGVMALADELVGQSLVPHNELRTQVALRFPAAPGETPTVPSPHIDGMYTPDNGLLPGDIYSFTLLAGIVLGEMSEPNSGNFEVWPGSHHELARHFARVGPQSLLEGMPQVDLGGSVQIIAEPGDLVLAHYQLAHAVGVHTGTGIRYMTFNRFEAPSHAARKWECMVDIWEEWPAMQSFVQSGLGTSPRNLGSQ